MSSDALLPASAETPSNKQRMFLRYYTGFLMDLVVLNLFAEYWSLVTVDTFTTSLWAALLLQVLLIQPAKDASLGPSHVLGAAAVRAGKPLTVKIYPATGPSKEQAHCFGGASGMHVWAEDAKAFFTANLP